jgi:hypothetical protein
MVHGIDTIENIRTKRHRRYVPIKESIAIRVLPVYCMQSIESNVLGSKSSFMID